VEGLHLVGGTTTVFKDKYQMMFLIMSVYLYLSCILLCIQINVNAIDYL
jgi:hypothetical protein